MSCSQARNLVPHLDVTREHPAGPPRRRPAGRSGAGELLEQVGLAGRGRAVPAQLSGGELARAGLAVALANDPDVILADEPTGELDGATEQEVLALLRKRTGRGAGLLVVTHSAEVVRIADRVVTLRDGAVARMTEIVVTCDDVSRTYGTGPSAVVAVHGTSCEVPAGARIAVAGPSGSGKSTLLHLMAGLERPTRGEVSWPGLPVTAETRAHLIGVVFQSPSLVPTLNVAENTGLPLVIAGVDRSEVARRVAEALELVDLAELAAKLPEEISGGQAQRVAVARVLARRPRLVLADEPTGQLDHTAGRRLLDALLAATDHVEAALVVTTHDTAVADRLDTHWTMRAGRLLTTVVRS